MGEESRFGNTSYAFDVVSGNDIDENLLSPGCMPLSLGDHSLKGPHSQISDMLI